jgi:septal ring factor EnvC (AmiA/AmiB activator)
MKEKHGSGMIYALADYKQLVLAYKTKYAELVKTVTFWRTSVIWLAILTIGITVMVIFSLADTQKSLAESNKNINLLNNKLKVVSDRLDSAHQELKVTKEELEKKEMLIRELEKNMSTTSKKLLEKVLKE